MSQLTGEFTEAAVMHVIGGNHTYLAAEPSVSNYRRLRMIGLESERVGATPEGEVGTTLHVPAVLDAAAAHGRWKALSLISMAEGQVS